MDTVFDGSFKFTNNSKEDFTFFWNNKEYIFPAESSSPMIIANESLENIQEIRKRAAYKWAVRELFKSPEGRKLEKVGSGFLNPATYDEKILEPYIQQCLNPLPIKAAVVKEGKSKAKTPKEGTVALGNSSVGSMSSRDGEFADYVPPVLGSME